MTQDIHEQISAFIDGELPEAEAQLLVRRLATDAGLRRVAARMLRVSQLVRGETSRAPDDFATRVLASIHDEPALPDEPTAGEAPRQAAAGTPAWLRLVTGGGIAAGVAAMVLVALPDAERLPAADTAPVPQAAADAPAGLAEAPDAFEYTVPSTATESGLVSANPELAAYYLSHSVNTPSLAPGSGRVRMLSGEAMPAPERVEDAEAVSR